jgi:hypothetical protein
VAVFQAMLAWCLEHFFPDAILEAEEDSAPVAWQAGGRASFRLGEPGGRSGWCKILRRPPPLPPYGFELGRLSSARARKR